MVAPPNRIPEAGPLAPSGGAAAVSRTFQGEFAFQLSFSEPSVVAPVSLAAFTLPADFDWEVSFDWELRANGNSTIDFGRVLVALRSGTTVLQTLPELRFQAWQDTLTTETPRGTYCARRVRSMVDIDPNTPDLNVLFTQIGLGPSEGQEPTFAFSNSEIDWLVRPPGAATIWGD